MGFYRTVFIDRMKNKGNLSKGMLQKSRFNLSLILSEGSFEFQPISSTSFGGFSGL
jgi:hypothetical protein